MAKPWRRALHAARDFPARDFGPVLFRALRRLAASCADIGMTKLPSSAGRAGPCLVCGRRLADAHHLRFAQSPALGRKVSDEFTVPLCRGHHREVHRCGDEAVWWKTIGIDPSAGRSRSLA